MAPHQRLSVGSPRRNPTAVSNSARRKPECGRNSWSPGTPNNHGCFNWMIPNLYIENDCFTKHPFINGCLGFQAEMMLFVERMAWAMPVFWLKKTLVYEQNCSLTWPENVHTQTKVVYPRRYDQLWPMFCSEHIHPSSQLLQLVELWHIQHFKIATVSVNILLIP